MKFSKIVKSVAAAGVLSAIMVTNGCNNGSSVSGYTTSTNGLEYKILNDSKQAKGKVGDYVQFYTTLLTVNDSLIFTMPRNQVPELAQISAPREKGDPIEILTMLGKGDSASCIIAAEVFFKDVALPPALKKGDRVKLNIKISDVFSKDQYESKLAEIDAQKAAVLSKPATDYMLKNNLNGTPMPGGMFYIIDKQGIGAQPENGKLVKVNYRGTLLDGTEFDSSMKPDRQPFEFVLGQGQVIKGWDQGIPMFKVGGKGKLIIPPSMAYGETGQGNIPPNSWLVFEIEVLGVSDPPLQY